MSAVVFYTDESGSAERFSEPLEPGATPVFTLTSIALPLNEWRTFDRKYNNLKDSINLLKQAENLIRESLFAIHGLEP